MHLMISRHSAGGTAYHRALLAWKTGPTNSRPRARLKPWERWPNDAGRDGVKKMSVSVDSIGTGTRLGHGVAKLRQPAPAECSLQYRQLTFSKAASRLNRKLQRQRFF